MAPSLNDYLRGLARLWWIPVAGMLVGVGLGALQATRAEPSAATSTSVLFTLRAEDPGTESEGSARLAENRLGALRLANYVHVARSSDRVRQTLADVDIEPPVTVYASGGAFADPSAQVLIDATGGESGAAVVDIWVRDEELSEGEATQLVQALARDVAAVVMSTDQAQSVPSLLPDPVLSDVQQVVVEPGGRITRAALPGLVFFVFGLGLVYLLVWRRGVVYTRRDIEERLGARVLADLTGSPSDGASVALALTKGRAAHVEALILPVGRGSGSVALRGIGDRVVEGGRDVGLAVRLVSLGADDRAQVSVAAAHQGEGLISDSDGSVPVTSRSLRLVTADGLGPEVLATAASVDVVALVVEYGVTAYGDVTAMGSALAGVTEADITVIGSKVG